VNQADPGAGPAWLRRTEGEARWAVGGTVVVAIGLQMSLPNQYALHPRWLLPLGGAALLVATVVMNIRQERRGSNAVRATSVLLTALLSLANGVSAVRLIDSLLNGHIADATALLRWGGTIWLTNIVIFALWYWELDRGGPAARAAGHHRYPDLLFTQMATPEVAPDDWEPTFVDYFYLAFTNATAFSPTDVLPLTRWAKLLMLLQSAVSFSIVVLVIARAVNILN
jgi:uncharacterized membrane protein